MERVHSDLLYIIIDYAGLRAFILLETINVSIKIKLHEKKSAMNRRLRKRCNMETDVLSIHEAIV